MHVDRGDIRRPAGLQGVQAVQNMASMRFSLAFLVVAAVGCSRGTPVVALPPPASTADAGPVVVSGAPDAGPLDAGPPDAGPDPHHIGGLGLGPFPADPLTIYGSAQGLLEPPISASVDEAENLWVVSQRALYLLPPGAKVFPLIATAVR